MRRPIRALRQGDPARDLGLTLDERAEAELDALISPARAAPRPISDRPIARARMQPVVVTGLVAGAIAVVTIPLLLHAPSQGRTAAEGERSRDTVPVTPSTTPSASPTSTLIAPDGWRIRSRAELHAFVVGDSMLQEDKRNAAIWEEQAWLDMQCMAQKGFVYDPIGEQADNAQHEQRDRVATGLTEQQQQEYQLAFWGKNTAVPYDWRDAGCHGRSVHLTGQDDAH